MSSVQFSIELNISNHPCSWGVDYADCPTNPPWEKVVQCIADAGYAGTELGPVGYYSPDKLGDALRVARLQLVAGNIFEKLHESQELPKILEKVHASCKILRQHGAKFFVIVPHVVEERIATAGRPADAPRLPDDRWAQLMDAIREVAKVVGSYGIQCTLHPHAGCWIEYADEVERAMADLPGDVALCLDTGHFTYAGMDAVASYRKYASRVPYMHFKDINGGVLAALQQEKLGFWDGIKRGVFCPLGRGLMDFPAVLAAMQECGFKGWVTVEQDADNSIADESARLSVPLQCCKLNAEYLRSIGVVSPGMATSAADSYTGRFDGSQSKHASPAMAAATEGAGAAAAADPTALPTSVKWSVLSSRVEGLVAELAQVVGNQDQYCVSQSKAEGTAMRAVREKMLATPWADEWAQRRTMFSYGEEMSTDPLEAMLLKQLSFMAAPRRILEIGMFVGYGSTAMLEGCATSQVVSLEIDPYLKSWLAECLRPFPEVAARHQVVVGPALESLPTLTGEFDMVFVDANKAEYKRYVEVILERNLLSARGAIVADNVLYNGYPYVHSHFDAQPARRHYGDAIREFNQWVSDHPLLEQVVLPIRDGISIIRRRSSPSAAPIAAAAQVCEGQQMLARQDSTWSMVPAAKAEVLKHLPGVEVSDARITERAVAGALKEWCVSSPITFEYRVVEEVNTLDPKSTTLLYGHLSEKERHMIGKHRFKYVVIVDSEVFKLYGDRITGYFEAHSAQYKLLVLETVEENKNTEMVLQIAEAINTFGIDRRLDPVIAIGGGVCMDVVGFAASIYRRRTPYVRVPTTLIGYVDASVGAKTGCNFCNKKNKLGAYIPPKLAVLDRSFLQTLDQRQLSNGAGEILKMALMKDARLFELLEAHGPQLIKQRFQASAGEDPSTEVLQRAIITMLEELAPNLWEDCLERLVDYGHVFSMELEMGVLFDEKLFHGEAVTIDMAFCSVLAHVRGQISKEECARTFKVMRGLQLPCAHPRFDRKLCEKAIKDRVEFSQGQKMPLPIGIGKAGIFDDVTMEQVDKALNLWPCFAAGSEQLLPEAAVGA